MADITDLRQAELARTTLTRQLELLNERLAMAQEEERRKIAYELHEQLGQELTSLKFFLQTPAFANGSKGVEALQKEALAVAAQAIERIRRLVLDLVPPELADFGLDAAARAYCLRQAAAGSWNLHIDARKPDVRAPQPVEMACFRVLQECLDSVLPHAMATEVWIQLHQDADKLLLRIRDNGVGFAPTTARADNQREGGNLGLLGMQMRAKQVGGSVEVKSAAGAGTEIRAIFPLSGSTAKPVRT